MWCNLSGTSGRMKSTLSRCVCAWSPSIAASYLSPPPTCMYVVSCNPTIFFLFCGLTIHSPTTYFSFSAVHVQVMQMNLQETVRKQIVQELKINQATQNPYVVVYHHAFYQNGAISILLEYMDGGSLADIVKQVRQVPEPYLSVISKQVRTYVRTVANLSGWLALVVAK